MSRRNGRAEKPVERERRTKTTIAFTDPRVEAIPYARGGQRKLYWDTGGPGLHLLVGSRTKGFRVQYKLHGNWVTRKLGQLGDPVLDEYGFEVTADVRWARDQAKRDRDLAAKGIDPREEAKARLPDTTSFEGVVDQFIEHYAKHRQRTWKQTEQVLKNSCKPWLRKPLSSITKKDAKKLLRGFVAEGHGPKARITLAWLRTLWKFAVDEEIVSTNIMLGVSVEYEPQARERFYTDDEVMAIWLAADKLDPVERDYVKLLMLLAPRKSALAGMQRSHLDDVENPTLWTTPFELTKSRKLRPTDNPRKKKRTYLTPLPPLAQRILKGRLKGDGDLVFPGRTRGKPIWPGSPLTKKLVKEGAPDDFNFHAARHTLATWLQNAGYSDFELGLVLNHSGRSGATASYSHGYPLEKKRELLDEWASHVEALVTPMGAALLR